MRISDWSSDVCSSDLGIVAPETAAHAAGTSALLPMLTLGIPGSPTAAVLLGGLLIWGLQPGPMLFIEQPDFVWGLIASMYLGNIAGLIVVLTTVPLFAAILRIPFSIIAPVRSEEHTSDLQSLMRNSYAVFCLK